MEDMYSRAIVNKYCEGKSNNNFKKSKFRSIKY